MSTRKRNKAEIDLEAASDLMLKHPLFSHLRPEQAIELGSFIEVVPFAPGEALINEGQLQRKLYVILSGQVCITRRESEPGQEVILTSIGRGALVGENAALLSRRAMASVVAESSCRAACLDVERLRQASGSQSLWTALLDGTAQELATKLEEAGTRSVSFYRWQLAQINEKRTAGSFTLRVLVYLGLYSLLSTTLLSTALNQRGQSQTLSLLITGGLLMLCALGTGLYMRDNRLKPAEFGLSLHKWSQHAIEALKLSVPLMAGVVALKGLMLQLAGTPDAPLFQPMSPEPGMLALLLVGVPLLSVAQEFVVRSGIQGSLQIFYTDDKRRFPWQAILVSNLLYAAAYAHMGPFWAVLAFVPGLFWGWLFARQNSLVGVGLSHALLSLWALLVVGYPLN